MNGARGGPDPWALAPGTIWQCLGSRARSHRSMIDGGSCSESMASERIFADDTPLPVLDPERGRTRTGRLWAYTRDDRSYVWIGSDY